MLQLNPPLPVVTPKGGGWAYVLIDRSQEHPVEFVVALDEGGEIWVFNQEQVRMHRNLTYGRTADPSFQTDL